MMRKSIENEIAFSHGVAETSRQNYLAEYNDRKELIDLAFDDAVERFLQIMHYDEAQRRYIINVWDLCFDEKLMSTIKKLRKGR